MARSTKEVEKELAVDREEVKAQDKVKFTIPKDRNNPVKHVWVCVNGQEYYLAVGKEIEAPRPVYEVWLNSYNKTIEAEEAMEGNFEL